MDDYKKELHKAVDGVYLHCECCNSFHGKDKPKLNRMARRQLKQRDKREITKEEFLEDVE